MGRALSHYLIAALAAVTLAAGSASLAKAQDTIKLGAMATLEGAFAVLGQESMRGVEMALEEFNYEVAGKKITLVKESSDATPTVAVEKARKLFEHDKVDIIIGPLSGSEGLALRDYSKTMPDKTIINGTSAAQDTTLRDSSTNFFRFNTDGAQWHAGLGSYIYDEMGYRRIVTLGEDYPYPYTQVAGLMYEFCGKGGHVVEKFWVPIGHKDYTSVIARFPDDIDAIYVGVAGADAVNFFTQYYQAGGDKPIVGGSVTLGQELLSSKGPFRRYLPAAVSAGPVADSDPSEAWKGFVALYKERFPDGLNIPSLFSVLYYVNTKAALLALQKVGGDLSDGQAKFRAVLAKLEFETPVGPVKLDENRQAIGRNYVTKVVEADDGTLYNEVVQVLDGVNQTLGIPRDEFLAFGPVSRENPSCP